MMCKEKSNKWSRAKALYILPVAAIAALSFSTAENANAEPAGKVNEFVADSTISRVENNSQVVEVDYIYDVSPASANDDPEKIHEVVEVQPEFPGGMKEMAKYIKSNLKYPESAAKVGAEGKSYVQFVVKTDGSIDNVEIMRSSGNEALDAEALRVVRAMPKWKPAMNKGKAVNVKFVLPIIYKLPKETPVIKLKGGGAAVDKEHNASIVVDGELYENDITDINSLDIESMTVVKKERLSAEELEKYKAGDKDGVIYITMKKPLKTEGVEIELNPAPEQMAEFPGGLQEMMKYLGSNTKYPLVAREAGLQGRIFVQFIVGEDGAISDAKVIKAQYEIWYYGEEAEALRAKLNQARIDLDELVAKNASEEEILAQSKVVAQYNAQFDDAVKMSIPRLGKLESNGDYLQKSLEAEALRVVESMPKWNPGMQGGKPVNTQYVFPIVFRLN